MLWCEMGRHPVDTSIYFNIESVWHKLRTLNFLIGGRGIGKTYSTIDKIVNLRRPFIYLRNTDVQLSESASFMGNPFKKWNSNNDRNLYLVPEKKHYNIIDPDDDNKIIGHGLSLSTCGNLRGVDFSDIKYVIYDEFIEKRPLMFDQFDNFNNLVETINRNREIEGEDPCIFICLSNAQKVDNPILIGYGLVPAIEQMMQTGSKMYRTPAIMLMMPDAKVSKLKEETSLYIAAKGSAFSDQALANKFSNDNFHHVKKLPINEFSCLYKIDDMYIWKHKHENHYYVCSVRAENVPEYDTRAAYSLFYRNIGLYLREVYYQDRMWFSDYVMKSRFTGIYK